MTKQQAAPPSMEGCLKQTIMEITIKQQQTDIRQVLDDVYEEINWAYLAKNYFGKSRAWLYHKFSGRNNGVADDFNDIDREKLRSALKDISERVSNAADRL